MFKKSTLGLVAGALAFGLTAASAAVTSFTINSVQSTGSTEVVSAVLTTSPCTGVYDITWNVDSAGRVTGGTATRTAPAGTDDNLKFCADVPAGMKILNGSDQLLAEVEGTTDSSGNFTFSSWPYQPDCGGYFMPACPSGPILAADYKVQLAIGPTVTPSYL